MTRVKKRYLLAAPVLAATLMALIGYWTHREVSRTIETKLKGELETVLNANATAMEIWMRNQERLAGLIADDPSVRQLSLTLLNEQIRRTGGRLDFTPLPDQNRFHDLMADRLTRAGYGVVLLVRTNLQIVGAAGRGRLRTGGTVRSEHASFFQEVFATGKPMVATPFKVERPRGPGQGRGGPPRGPGELRPEPSERRPPPDMPPPSGGEARPPSNLMQVLAPLKDAGGKVAGVLAFVLRPEDEFTKVLSVARPGETGETFAFDHTGRLISQSRFDEQLKQLGLLTNQAGVSSALTLELRDPGVDLTEGKPTSHGALKDQPLMPMVAEAVAGGTGVTVVPARDYRGVPVVGAWRWLPEQNLGLVTKMDASEAYQPLRVLRRISLVLLLLLALVTLSLLFFSYLNAVWRRRFNEARLKERQLGQYTLGERIGEGAMGVVYKARHALLRRETAVKLLLPDRADAALVRQFEHEVRLTCQLSHPNTIQVYDYGHTADGIFYYAMELLHGMTLAELVEQQGSQPDGRVIHLLVQVCGSLCEAHQAGLIHRDIKPGNIFLCQRGGIADTVKVLDFGLVRLARDAAGGANALHFDGAENRLLGTPQYLAPEIIRDVASADPRSDIYALGVVGYQLLTGGPVFAGETVPAVLNQHLEEQPEPLGQRCAGRVSPELGTLIMRCLEKDAGKRPQTMVEVEAALRACVPLTAWLEPDRAAWWEKHGADQKNGSATGPATPRSAVEATLKIDFATREK